MMKKLNKEWHEDEKVWWNLHGNYMTYQWKLNPYLNSLLRTGINRDFNEYLLMSGGNLLDIGCGSGWLARSFSKQGMFVTGIDVSQEQIDDANLLKDQFNDKNLSFICCDLLDWNVDKYESFFDAIFVSAFLHHLPNNELDETIQKLSFVLKKGGRVYLYEPLESDVRRNFIASVIDYLNTVLSVVLLNYLPKWFRLHNKRHEEEIKNGYIMQSPRERPLQMLEFEKILSRTFEIKEIRGRHIYSIGFAMQTMGLKKFAIRIYSSILTLFYVWEQFLIKVFGWQPFSRKGRFIMCSFKLEKR